MDWAVLFCREFLMSGKETIMNSGPNTSPPNKKPLFHPKGHLTRALWSDRAVLYQENPPVHQLEHNRKLAAKLESLLIDRQQKQDAHYADCPKLRKFFEENLASQPQSPTKKKLNIRAMVVALLKSLTKARLRRTDLGVIKGNIGDQNYKLDNDLDLAKYRAVSIWCKRFSVNFGAAALKPIEPSQNQ
jgi:hypothetical protein